MITFKRFGEPVVWGTNPHADQPTQPCTWRPFVRTDDPAAQKKPWADILAYTTCSNGHEQILSSSVHKVAADGTISPSYVCPCCSFHEFVRLEGWNG